MAVEKLFGKATEIELIPAQELATGQAAAIRNLARDAVVRMASMAFREPAEKLLVRDIQPYTSSDLDFTYRSWYETTGTSANAYETMTTGTMGDRRYVGFYGVKVTTGSCNMIKITVGGSIKTIWHLEGLYPLFEGGAEVGFCPSVIVIPQRMTYKIERFVVEASAPTQIVLRGFVIEPYGRTMSP